MKVGWIGIGCRPELRLKDQYVVTSPVRVITPRSSCGLKTAVAMRIERPVMSCSAARVAVFAVIALWASARTTDATCVDVALQFREGQPATMMVESMKKEASSIWAPYGVWLGWPTASGLPGCARPQFSFDVLVHRLPSAGPISLGQRIILGRTRVMPSTIRHAPVDIDFGATERLIEALSGQLFQVLGRYVAPVDLGRALGRVLAHEIGHVVLAAAEHQSRGLMRASFVADDLIRPQRRSYRLSEAEVARLRERELVLDYQASPLDR